jgi:hypothetical protein
MRADFRNEIDVSVPPKLLTQPVQRPPSFQLCGRFSQRQTFNQSHVWEGLGSGVINLAEALMFKSNRLKVSERISGGKSILERAIMKTRERQLLLAKEIQMVDKRFRDYENFLWRNRGKIQGVVSVQHSEDCCKFGHIGDPVEN